MSMTDHGRIRSQQRGIPPLVIDLLFQFGRREHDHIGAEIIYFDKKAKKRVESYVGGLIGKLNEHMDCYAVLSDGQVITVGTRYKKITH